jgi:DNA-binding GntR family transcriptional regulator
MIYKMRSGRPSPVYARAHNRLLLLLSQEIPLGGRLPVQTKLAERCGASRTTIHHLLGNLQKLGLVSAERNLRLLRLPLKKDFLPEPRILSRREEVEQAIMTMLVEGRLKPGARFSELGLARTHGVTTGTIREALLRLARLGVFTKSDRKQWQVAKIDEAMLNEMMDLRGVYELFALTRYFQIDRSPGPFVRLLAEMKKLARMDPIPRDAFFRLDRDLHRTILTAAQNRYLGANFQFLSFPLHFQLLHHGFGPKLLRKGLLEHLALLRAIVAGDRKRSLISLKKHLETARHTLLGFLVGASRE